MAYGLYQWKQTQAVFPVGGDCGNYSEYIGRDSNKKAEIAPEQKAVVVCMMQAYKKCLPATATIFSSDWEGGSHTTTYQVHQTSNDTCEASVTSETNAWYAPEAGTLERACSEFLVENNQLICK